MRWFGSLKSDKVPTKPSVTVLGYKKNKQCIHAWIKVVWLPCSTSGVYCGSYLAAAMFVNVMSQFHATSIGIGRDWWSVAKI